jgi:hypothetical protein
MNLKRVFSSLRLNPQTVRVYRSFGEFASGGWREIPQDPLYFEVEKVIVVPASEKELKQVPEADRVIGGMMFWVPVPSELYITRTGEYQGTSDKVLWNGDLYKILNVMPYKDYGFSSSLGQRESGV